MKVLITGVCGFVGSALAIELARRIERVELVGLDNLSRPGSEQNRHLLKKHGVRFLHGDLRNPSDLESLPRVDWVIDAAANPSVLASFTGQASSRQLMEHNLFGTVHLLEYCKRHSSGLILLSTSRVYSLAQLSFLPMETRDDAFRPKFDEIRSQGLSPRGVNEEFSTASPVSLYGATKLASEILGLEYALACDIPIHINRCGVLAGPGQFGKADQGIFSYWIHCYQQGHPLKYIGFDGTGRQVRDCLHPRDLAALISLQLQRPSKAGRVLNVSGGTANSLSLAQLSEWCAQRFVPRQVLAEQTPRRYDVPWLVLDSGRAAQEWNWSPTTPLESILEEIATHAEEHPGWVDLSKDS